MRRPRRPGKLECSPVWSGIERRLRLTIYKARQRAGSVLAIAGMGPALFCVSGQWVNSAAFSTCSPRPESRYSAVMAHLKPGRIMPTLIEYYVAGFRHLEIRCRVFGCHYTAPVEIGPLLGKRRNYPVNFLRWRCKKCDCFQVDVTPIQESRCEICARASLRIVRPGE
jgi:hypothetical protein